mmetsp:Transcript_15419/g.36811  ORF Transcript_15419/g.36811 Transcript_15419/m.36811 type:complete len:207 (-) Transcript_15419:34-654(-)
MSASCLFAVFSYCSFWIAFHPPWQLHVYSASPHSTVRPCSCIASSRNRTPSARPTGRQRTMQSVRSIVPDADGKPMPNDRRCHHPWPEMPGRPERIRMEHWDHSRYPQSRRDDRGASCCRRRCCCCCCRRCRRRHRQCLRLEMKDSPGQQYPSYSYDHRDHHRQPRRLNRRDTTADHRRRQPCEFSASSDRRVPRAQSRPNAKTYE